MTQLDSHIPEYILEDKDQEIIITIISPLAKPREAALILENDVFIFDSPPYYLKIKLPHPVSDEFSEKAFNVGTGTYKVKFQKATKKQENNLDGENETISPAENPSIDGETGLASNETEVRQFYGFANKYSNMFGKLYYEFTEVVNLPDPDNTAVEQRRELKIKEESEKWNDDHYLADTMETDHLESIFKYEPPWITSPVTNDLNNDEKEMLAGLMKTTKICNISKEMEQLSEFQIVDILFCYAYNKRTTEGDNTVESGWTINKLSSTLSWFEVFENLKAVILSCYKRSLIYPLYRNWDLTRMIHNDVINILKIGSKQVTRCLLEVMEIFNESENRYLLNNLYLNDLCNFAYHRTNDRYFELAKEVKKIKIEKFEVNGDLPVLEIAARLTLEEEIKSSDNTAGSGLKKVVKKIGNLKLDCKNGGSTDSSESDNGDSGLRLHSIF